MLIGDYLAHCLSEGRRRNTVENAYGYRFATCSYRGARGRIDQPSQLTRRTMERYQGELLAKGGVRGPFSPSTVHSYVRVVNQMLVWAREGQTAQTWEAGQRHP